MRAWTSNRACAALACALGLTGCGGGDTVDIAVETVEPAQGPLGGGQVVTVRGEGFLAGGAAPNLALVGDMLTSEVSALSDIELQIVTPPGAAPGSVDVIIFNANGYGMAAEAYEYVDGPTVTAVAPASGHYKGGDEVTITGTGFEDHGAGQPTVTFDGSPATEVRVVSDTEILAIVPAGRPLSLATVAVNNARGQAERAEAYEYTQQGGLLALTGRRARFEPEEGLYYVDTETGESTRLFPVDADRLAVQGMATAADGTVYGVSGLNNLLYRIDFRQQEFVPVGPLAVLGGGGGATIRLTDIEFHGGVLYGYSHSPLLYGSINTDTGVFTQLGNVDLYGGLYDCCGGRSLVSDGEALYYWKERVVWSIDPTTGAPLGDPVGGFDLAPMSGGAMVNGTMYGARRFETGFGGGGPQSARIFAIDPDASETSTIATLPTGIHALAPAPGGTR